MTWKRREAKSLLGVRLLDQLVCWAVFIAVAAEVGPVGFAA